MCIPISLWGDRWGRQSLPRESFASPRWSPGSNFVAPSLVTHCLFTTPSKMSSLIDSCLSCCGQKHNLKIHGTTRCGRGCCCKESVFDLEYGALEEESINNNTKATTLEETINMLRTLSPLIQNTTPVATTPVATTPVATTPTELSNEIAEAVLESVRKSLSKTNLN